jgi:hypothetical protein
MDGPLKSNFVISSNRTVSNTNIKEYRRGFYILYGLRNCRDLMNTQGVTRTLPLLVTPVESNRNTHSHTPEDIDYFGLLTELVAADENPKAH